MIGDAGGTIQVISAPGEGTEVRVDLPVPGTCYGHAEAKNDP